MHASGRLGKTDVWRDATFDRDLGYLRVGIVDPENWTTG